MTENQCNYAGYEFGDPQTHVCENLLDQAWDGLADVDRYNLYLPVWEFETTPMCSAEENKK